MYHTLYSVWSKEKELNDDGISNVSLLADVTCTGHHNMSQMPAIKAQEKAVVPKVIGFVQTWTLLSHNMGFTRRRRCCAAKWHVTYQIKL